MPVAISGDGRIMCRRRPEDFYHKDTTKIQHKGRKEILRALCEKPSCLCGKILKINPLNYFLQVLFVYIIKVT